MRALCIMGPTASGKSALALRLAERLGGEIVNADSMQVYAGLRTLTARPSPAEEALAPHHLYGVIDPGERYSVGRWLKDAGAILAGITARGRSPIIVGGTGLYFKALTEGLTEAPAAPEDLLQALRAEAASAGAGRLHQRLMQIDPDTAAKLSPNDAPRIIRALSVFDASGERLSSLQTHTTPALAPGSWLGVALTPDRKPLYAAIDARFDAMINAGALDEARAISARGLDPSLPAMKAHGLPWLMAHLRGEMEFSGAVALAQRDTRRYAKRQFTWIANQMPSWARLETEDPTARAGIVEKILRANWG